MENASIVLLSCQTITVVSELLFFFVCEKAREIMQ